MACERDSFGWRRHKLSIQVQLWLATAVALVHCGSSFCGSSFASDSLTAEDPTFHDPDRHTVVLSGITAETLGPPVKLLRGSLQYWHDVETAARWNLMVVQPSEVDVELVAAVADPYAGAAFEIRIGDEVLQSELISSGGWEAYRTFRLGTLAVEPGEQTITLQATHLPKGAFGNVRSIRLRGIHTARPPSEKLNESGPFQFVSTARFGHRRLTPSGRLPLAAPNLENGTTLVVDLSRQFQTIEGFGGAFTEAAASVFRQLRPERQREILDAYFDAETGHGYRLCRTHINSCDFSLGSYAYTEVEGDVDLEHFNIDRDRQYLIPLIRAAQKTAGDDRIKLFASPWSPPAWMKNKRPNDRWR